MSLEYRPATAARDGMLRTGAFCKARDGFLCPIPVPEKRPSGAGRKRRRKWGADGTDFEELRYRSLRLRRERDRKDQRDLAAILQLLTGLYERG